MENPERRILESESRYYGVYVGVVTSLDDPDKLARVRVRFPLLPTRDESYWARMAVMMAGRDRGSFFLPEVHDEVLVVFEEGEVEKPYVIGMLWNGQERPPHSVGTDGKNDIRMIRSRSGHEVLFDDTAGQERITIQDKTKEHRIIWESRNNSISVESDTGSVRWITDGDVVVETGNIHIITGQKQVISGGKGVVFSSGGLTQIAATSMATFKGGIINLNVAAGGPQMGPAVVSGEHATGTTQRRVPGPPISVRPGDAQVPVDALALAAAKKSVKRKAGPEPQIIQAWWDRTVILLGETVEWAASVNEYIPNGSRGQIRIYTGEPGGENFLVASVSGLVEAGEMRGRWTPGAAERALARGKPAIYHFLAEAQSAVSPPSNILTVQDAVEVTFRFFDGTPMQNAVVRLTWLDESGQATGRVVQAQLDSQGTWRAEHIPPGKIQIELMDEVTPSS